MHYKESGVGGAIVSVHIAKGSNQRHVAQSYFADLHQALSRRYTHDSVGDGKTVRPDGGSMRGKKLLPPELETIRDAARLALGPVIPATSQSHANHHFLFDAKRTEAGRELPPYYLVYFLLVSNFLGSRT